jgi:hypothetical protein
METHRAETPPWRATRFTTAVPKGAHSTNGQRFPIFKLKIFVVSSSKQWRPKQTGGSMTRDDEETVYSNIQMPMSKGRELSRLVAELQSSVNHLGLESVFKEIQDELNSSIEFVEEQLRGEIGFGRRLS